MYFTREKITSEGGLGCQVVGFVLHREISEWFPSPIGVDLSIRKAHSLLWIWLL